MERAIFVILLLAAVCYSKPVAENDNNEKFEYQITVFPWNNHFGASATVTLNESTTCGDIPKLWQRKISSVNTNGQCAILCSQKNCKGKCIKVSPGSRSHNRLRDLNFDKTAVSIGVCPKSAKPNKTKSKGKKYENETH